MNAWPALSRIFLDGWVVGLSEGYTRRANSVNPLYPGTMDLIGRSPNAKGPISLKDCPPFSRSHRSGSVAVSTRYWRVGNMKKSRQHESKRLP